MSGGHPVPMPQLGQAMEFGTLSEWLVGDGETVTKGQAIASVESDKASYELEAPAGGILKHVVAVGDEVPVGDNVALVGEAGTASSVKPTLEGAAATVSGAGQPVPMPQLGQAMEFGTLSEWLVADGETVTKGQAIASVESDKASYELEAPADGILRHTANVGDEVPVGDNVAFMGDGAEAAPGRAAQEPAHRTAAAAVSPIAGPSGSALTALASPKARAIAVQRDVDLVAIAPRRADGLITALDVENAVASGQAKKAGQAVALSGLRRTAADRLARSWQQAPHFVQMIEVDATQMSRALAAIRAKQLGCSLNDIIAKTVADTLAEFPDLNAVFVDGALMQHDTVNIGLAVATEKGLTVPVLRDVAAMSLNEVAASNTNLIARAREGRLSGGDFGPGSVTISNLGRYGVAFGTPVLNLDEPILIFIGAIEDRPVGRDGAIVLAPMTTLSICYDHRVADGLRAAEFSQAVKVAFESLAIVDLADEAAPSLGDRELRARSSAGLAVDIQASTHRWIVDEPRAIGGEDKGPDPVTVALGGLVSCLVVSFRLVAQRRNVAIGRIEAGLMATPTGKVKEVAITMTVWSDAEVELVERLLAPAKKGCYVHDMLRSDLPIHVDLVVKGSK